MKKTKKTNIHARQIQTNYEYSNLRSHRKKNLRSCPIVKLRLFN